jgi:hypothetical protein
MRRTLLKIASCGLPVSIASTHYRATSSKSETRVGASKFTATITRPPALASSRQTNSDGASATVRTRRQKGSELDADQGSNLRAD